PIKIEERAQNFSWTLSFDKSSAVTGESSQTSSRTIPASQKVLYTSAGSTIPASQSLSGTAQSSQSQTNPVLSRETCEYPCLNGGQCIRSGSCDCSLFQATGHRCQTVPNTGFEREMTCRTWGQYNFETFDGLYFYFPGRCTYTLLRDCEETTQASIVVQVHNDPSCSSAPYTCRRSVSLFLPWEGEIQLHTTNVTFKGQSLQLPHHIHDLQLDQISQYVVVTQQQGFTLAWEGRSGSIYIKLSPEFVGRTCGLCGNFNADVQDDLKTSYGVLTRDIEMFGNSWMEAEPHQGRCPTVFFTVLWLQEVEEVCAMLLDPPFQSCHDFVSPLSFMASCSNDLCRSGPSGDMVCQVFSEYARACAHADHPLHNWRGHIPQCVKQCPLGLQYRECISCCPESCNLERTCIDSKLACLDGCYCPDGLIYEDGSCVAPADCPCEYHGMFYPSGQMLQEECNNCTCVGGVWSCTDYSCPGECSVTGDMYFQSFDGRIFTFPATCQYVLAKSRNSGKFTITIQNAPCGNLDGACIQSVSLVIDEDPRTEITLSHVGEVFMAGQYRISLPYSDDIFHVQELSSMFLQVRTAFGLRLQYSWAEFRLYLQIEELWKDDTVGLCGTFNGNIQDDFLSPSGMIESTPQLFGNTWKVSSACSLSLSTPQLDPCDTHQQAVTYASEMCEVLNQDLFSACHEYFSPTPFYQQCRSDTCKCGTPCLCSALAHYARHCRRFSIIVDFRSHVSDCAVACPATMQYGTCVSSCQRRCSSLSVSQHCGEDCEEGCTCPQGSFYNHRTQTCVHRSECPCSFLGADYEPGDVIMTSADGLCPPGQLFQNCSDRENNFLSGRGVACERTCESYLLNITCSVHEPCVSGCACPPGLLKHGDECFEPAACPCLWKGKEYFPGDRVSSPCYQCICQHGTFQCVFPPCPSMCTAYGDRHYRTFDGLLFDYVGACKVYLVKSSADVMLSVTAENIDCFDTGVICRKSLLINIERSFILFDDDSGKPNPSSVIDRKQQMFIWPAGFFTVIHFPEEDVTILWDRKTTVHIQVGPRWQGKLSGLCGDFDLKTVNEMRTPDNIDSATPQEFGNSWTATECVNSPDIRHPCSLSPLREPFAKRQCAVLLSEVFQTCHPVVDVTWFYMNCLADTCACSRGGDCECFCTSVAAYAQRCCHEGIPIDWRSPSLCRKVAPVPTFIVFYLSLFYRAAIYSTRVNTSTATTAAGVLSQFMMTPGLSRARPHDSSRVSFEAADRPNFFLHASPSGQVRLAKWQESEVFWDGATFVLHRNTWIPGYDSLESHAKPGFFLHATLPHLHLLKFRHSYSFRKATLFRLTDTPPSPRCQWRYDSCVSPCFKTCSDPSAEACLTDSPQLFFTTTAVTTTAAQTTTSAEGPTTIRTTAVVHQKEDATKTTTRSTASSPVPAPVSGTSVVSDITTVSSTITSVEMGTSTKTTTVEEITMASTATTPPLIRPGLPSTSSTTVSPAPVSPPIETGTGSLSTVTSAKTTESLPPVLPFTTSKITETSQPVTTETIPTDQTTSTVSVLPTTLIHVTLSTTSSFILTSAAAEQQTTTKKVTVPESPASRIPTVSTVTAALPSPKVTDTTTSALSTSAAYTDRTSWSAPVPVTVRTTISRATSSPLVVPETSTMSSGLLFTTKPSTETTAVPPSPTTKSYSHPVFTELTSEPWRPPDWKTSSTPIYRPTVEITSEVIHVVTSTKTTEVPHAPVTSKLTFTSSTSPAVAATTAQTTTQEVSTPETGSSTAIKLVTPPPSPVPGSPETSLTTAPTRATPSAVTTTLKPVVIQPITETKKPVTDRVQVSTKSTTMSSPSLSPVHTTTSAAAPNVTTVLDKLTTRLVTSRATPTTTSTTIVQTTTFRTTPRIPMTTRVPPRATSTTIRPVTARVTMATRPSAITTRSTTLGSPTVAPATTSGVTFSTIMSANMTEHVHASAPSPRLTTTTTSVLPPYAEIIDECTRYICVNNQLVLFNKSQSCPFTAEPPNCGLLGFAVQVNGDKCCPKWDCPCRCSMFPDLNVITFDGNSFAIYKAASYVVTQLSNETLSVLVQESAHLSGFLNLMWNFTNLCLVSLNITHKSNHVVIDRLQRRVRDNQLFHGFEIYDTGNMYLIRSPSGLKVQWYHSTGMMVIDTDSSNKKLPTMGLCGFCDGDPTNDMTLPNGTTLGVSEALFIDSWQVPNTTSYVSYSRRREHNCSTSDCSHCLAMLENPAFTSCHAFVPPSLFCEVWVRDSEYVNNQCIALAAYVASCHKFNICIEWRSPDYCPFACPDTLQYQACLPACTSQSCPNHDFDSDPDQCSGLTEGCVCPEGTLLHRPYSALCIPHEKCACTDGSGAPRAHGEVWTASKDGCCMYRCDNDTIVPVEFNCSSMPAPVCHRTGEMIINMADDTSCCPHKICMCNQSLCDQLPPECKYGEKLVSYYRSDSCCPEHVCECDPDLCESTIIPTCRDDQTLIATRADGSCCIAHICTCSSCVKTRPICLDGEVLTVDSNVTDRCCPAYQCVCQPYRCPQLSCPVGMSVVSVSSPDRCCPNQTCVIHRNKQIKPGKNTKRIPLTSDVCCVCVCSVREAVCVFGERGVLRPGQTLVEHEDNGLCYSRQCSRILDPTSGFYLLRTSTVNCSTHCQPNQIYVPPKDQSTCCGVCKNISCLYQHENGTTGLYKPGKSWVSNCMKFDCTDTLLGPTLISYSFSCPPFNETECIKVSSKEDGKSCQKVTVRMTIRKNDCRSNRPVNIVSCDGKCPSASIYNYNINTYARFCKCCRETGLQRRSVQLYCSSNSTWVSYTIQEPTDCSCQWS
uniref:Otogelin n=1 Tax=Kryptolebias marmoratus TaxID=37003 RepID=A0A3Q3BGT7_KRYMA